ncbi:MAG: extracellular solute-binding protein, partial [Eubacteriales bacterium]
HVELAPPTNWNMFNIISNFFTRENTPNSPTPYGTSLFGGNNSAGICTELYPKMSAYNGTIFDNNGHVRLYTQEVRKAYQSLLDTIADAPPDTLNDSAFQGLQRLMDGETAMCISFSNNACYFLDSYANFFQENIGYAPVPGKKPIISGWSTSINAHSQNKELAWDFIQWFSGLEIASAFTLMGGAAPMTSLLQKESLVQMYPWYPMTVEQYHTGTRREAPTIHGAKQLNPSTVEDILASVVYTTLEGNISLETALFRAHRQLCQYAEANGYPKNIMPSQATIHRTH